MHHFFFNATLPPLFSTCSPAYPATYFRYRRDAEPDAEPITPGFLNALVHAAVHSSGGHHHHHNNHYYDDHYYQNDYGFNRRRGGGRRRNRFRGGGRRRNRFRGGNRGGGLFITIG